MTLDISIPITTTNETDKVVTQIDAAVITRSFDPHPSFPHGELKFNEQNTPAFSKISLTPGGVRDTRPAWYLLPFPSTYSRYVKIITSFYSSVQLHNQTNSSTNNTPPGRLDLVQVTESGEIRMVVENCNNNGNWNAPHTALIPEGLLFFAVNTHGARNFISSCKINNRSIDIINHIGQWLVQDYMTQSLESKSEIPEIMEKIGLIDIEAGRMYPSLSLTQITPSHHIWLEGEVDRIISIEWNADYY